MLKLLIAMEGRFLINQQGVYSSHLTYTRIWQRYTEVFEEVTVLARVSYAESIPVNWDRADGPGVKFHGLSNYQGLRGYLRARCKLIENIKEAVSNCDGAVLRVPGKIADLTWRELIKEKKRYALEVVGDPNESIRHAALPFPLNIAMAKKAARDLRLQCQKAIGAAYVTEKALQERYPCNGIQTSFSDVELSSGSFVSEDIIRAKFAHWKTVARYHTRPWRIIFVGSLSQPYKGLAILLNAIEECIRRGLDCNLRILGDGKLKSFYQKMAKCKGLGLRTEFLGRIPAGDAVIRQLDWADLFVLPSFTEGMPRAILEAMARGLPCIATPVGGIPEVLSDDVMVPTGRSDLLADAICRLLDSPERMVDLARLNLKKAMGFEKAALSFKRRKFYTELRNELIRHDY